MQNIMVLIDPKSKLPIHFRKKLNIHFGLNFQQNKYIKLNFLIRDEYENIHPLHYKSLGINSDTIFLEAGQYYYDIQLNDLSSLKCILDYCIKKSVKYAASYHGEVLTKVEYEWKIRPYKFNGYKYNWTDNYSKVKLDAFRRKAIIGEVVTAMPYGVANNVI